MKLKIYNSKWVKVNLLIFFLSLELFQSSWSLGRLLAKKLLERFCEIEDNNNTRSTVTCSRRCGSFSWFNFEDKIVTFIFITVLLLLYFLKTFVLFAKKIIKCCTWWPRVVCKYEIVSDFTLDTNYCDNNAVAGGSKTNFYEIYYYMLLKFFTSREKILFYVNIKFLLFIYRSAASMIYGTE